MSNPVAGQDFVVNMVSPESLTGSVVTIEYRTPKDKIEIGVTPTSVNLTTDTISYKISSTISIEGVWKIGAKIVNQAGEVSYVDPPVKVIFVEKLT